MPYTGPPLIHIIESEVPTNVTLGTQVTFTSGSGQLFAAYVGGPRQTRHNLDLILMGGTISNIPAPPIPTFPASADPPFPPVWPYLFSAYEVYGKDNANVNQSFVRGDTFVMNCTAILAENNLPLDLTGATLTMTARFQVTDTTPVFTLSSPSSGISITNAVAGQFTVTIPASATTSVPLTRTVLPFDIQYALGLVRYTLERGNFVIVPDVTTA